MSGIVQLQCEDGLATPRTFRERHTWRRGVGVANEVVKWGVAIVLLQAP